MIESLSEDYTFLGTVLYPLTKDFSLTNVSFSNLSEVDKMVLSCASHKIIASTKERLANLPQA
jgi:NADH:ubiquinone oxidoreductase subunit C